MISFGQFRMASRSKFSLPEDLYVDRSSSSYDNSRNSQPSKNDPTMSQCNGIPSSSDLQPPKSRPKFDLPSLSFDQLVTEENQQIIGPDFELHQNVRVTVSRGKGESGDQQYLTNSFEEANLSRQILQNLTKIRFLCPTAVQRCVIPLILRTNDDLLCLAATGTGKTGAFLIPLLNILHNSLGGFLRSASDNRRSPKAIIIAHTKELVLQIEHTARILADGTGIGIVLIMGELRYNWIKERIEREGCDVLIATPGRLAEFVRKSWIDLDCLQFLVIDEMDKFFMDNEFLQMFRELNDKTKKCKSTVWPCRTFLFSATSFEGDVTLFLRPDFFYVTAGQVDQSVSHVRQIIILTDYFKRRHQLEDILQKEATAEGCKKTVIFVNECRRCDRLAIMLSCYDYKAISINGNHTLQQRTKAMAEFNSGIYDILVGTDVIARGMNIPNLSRVILYEMPPLHRYEQFVHRVGRVGRAGNAGEAFVFFNPKDLNDLNLAEFLRNQLSKANQLVPVWLNGIVDEQNKWEMRARQLSAVEGKPTRKELDEDKDDLCDDGFSNSGWI